MWTWVCDLVMQLVVYIFLLSIYMLLFQVSISPHILLSLVLLITSYKVIPIYPLYVCMHYRAVYYALISIYSPHSPCVPLLMSTYPSCLPDLIFSPMYHILFMPCPLIYILNPSPTY